MILGPVIPERELVRFLAMSQCWATNPRQAPPQDCQLLQGTPGQYASERLRYAARMSALLQHYGRSALNSGPCTVLCQGQHDAAVAASKIACFEPRQRESDV